MKLLGSDSEIIEFDKYISEWAKRLIEESQRKSS